MEYNLFEKALIFAINKHKGQKRKFSGVSYIMHPISVCKIIEETKKSNNIQLLLIASLLHDTVEDCPNVSIEMIAKKFGHQVSSIVDELTSNKEDIKKYGKTQYLKEKMKKMSSYALCIKLADRLHNISDINSGSKEFSEKYKQETLEILSYISVNRKITKTHAKLIEKIETTLKNLN